MNVDFVIRLLEGMMQENKSNEHDEREMLGSLYDPNDYGSGYYDGYNAGVLESIETILDEETEVDPGITKDFDDLDTHAFGLDFDFDDEMYQK